MDKCDICINSKVEQKSSYFDQVQTLKTEMTRDSGELTGKDAYISVGGVARFYLLGA